MLGLAGRELIYTLAPELQEKTGVRLELRRDGIARFALTDEDAEIEIDASATLSHEERLKTLDFEQMSVAEVAEATIQQVMHVARIFPGLARHADGPLRPSS